MSANLLAKVLPYALMALVGLAGWSMQSTTLLSIVVLGTMGVAIGTSMTQRSSSINDVVHEINTVESALHEHHQISQQQ